MAKSLARSQVGPRVSDPPYADRKMVLVTADAWMHKKMFFLSFSTTININVPKDIDI
jgi:hypothetical protein